MPTKQKRLWLIKLLTICLVFSACLPQGFMLSRGAENLVEIVLCRGFGPTEVETVLYLDVDSGEYVELAEHQADESEGACVFTLASFDSADETYVFALSFSSIHRLALTPYNQFVQQTAYRLARSRAPPLQLIV
tara:strand:- start:36752 stop:37153 length:402 start_codon:yes stop_codon:yes gene_type:complete